MSPGSVVVVGATNVGVNGQIGQFRFFLGQCQGKLIQALLQDRGDALVAGRVDGQRPGTGLLQPVTAVTSTQVQQPQAGPVAMFGMGAILELSLHHVERGGADVRGPVQEPSGRPVLMGLVGFGHVLGQGDEAALAVAGMQRHPLALVHDFHGGVGHPYIQLHAHESVRHAVQPFVDLNVVVDARSCLTPLGINVGRCRQWLQCGSVQRFEQTLAALGTPLEPALVQRR